MKITPMWFATKLHPWHLLTQNHTCDFLYLVTRVQINEEICISIRREAKHSNQIQSVTGSFLTHSDYGCKIKQNELFVHSLNITFLSDPDFFLTVDFTSVSLQRCSTASRENIFQCLFRGVLLPHCRIHFSVTSEVFYCFTVEYISVSLQRCSTASL